MKYIGYYNGKIGALEEMTIPMLDRAVYFGDGCYDATTFAGNRIFAVKDHLDRFYNSLRLLELPFEMSRKELTAALQACIDANEEDHGMLYWQCSRGTAFRTHSFPGEGVKPNLMIFTVPYTLTPFTETFRLISKEDTRFLHCNIKTINLIPSVIAAQRAKEAGCEEAVLHRGERVTECSASNILMLKDGVLCSPPRDNLILPGISLKHLLELAPQVGLGTREEVFTMDELMQADEVIVSNSGCLCTGVTHIDGTAVGGKDPKGLKALQDAYADYYEKDTGVVNFIKRA